MRVKSPIGEYDYRVSAVRVKREGIEVDGSLGAWQTTMVVEPKDLKPVLPALVLALGLAVAISRRR
jgi:hypothetical protein